MDNFYKKKYKFAFTSLLAVAACIAFTPSANSYSLARKHVLAKGGPFVADKATSQRYIFCFDVTKNELHRPFEIVLYNGSNARPGYRRVKVFLEKNFSESFVTRKRLPASKLVFVNNKMKKKVMKVDISSKLQKGINTIVIEGKGPKGASISFELENLNQK